MNDGNDFRGTFRHTVNQNIRQPQYNLPAQSLSVDVLAQFGKVTELNSRFDDAYVDAKSGSGISEISMVLNFVQFR